MYRSIVGFGTTVDRMRPHALQTTMTIAVPPASRVRICQS
jgi:hypothetical protein